MDTLKRATIQDCEESVGSALSALRRPNFAELKNLQAIDILAPKGFRPVVELYENGRKKRNNASAENWSPATGEIRIYFEACDATNEASASATTTPSVVGVPSELFDALKKAEDTPGRMFVALKWFRDDYLPATGLAWAQNEEERRSAITSAIKDGWILTSRVPNPKAPLYPTTTIRLNRQRLAASTGTVPASRFRPVNIAGEELSSTILRERGSR
jgi:hypothetical protein